MSKVDEKKLRDHLFLHCKEKFATLIVGRRDPVASTVNTVPTIQFLLRRRVERKINQILDKLETLVLTAKELKINSETVRSTRVFLFGGSSDAGITVIKFKKAAQTEYEAFTELLTCANHFQSIYPGFEHEATTSVLVADMEMGPARNAYFQALVFEKKQVLALIPHYRNGGFFLEVYYPPEIYYQGLEKSFSIGKSMTSLAFSFPLIKGWIDSDLATEDGALPSYSADALNRITGSIAQALEAGGFHAFVSSSQQWRSLASMFPYPNAIFVGAINPFSIRTLTHDREVPGDSMDSRIAQAQAIFNRSAKDGYEHKGFDTIESHFQGALVRCVRDQIGLCFRTRIGDAKFEISQSDWGGVKGSAINSGMVHNLNTYTTGLLREIYFEYISHIYDVGFDIVYYNDDLPRYAFETLCPFYPVFSIILVLAQ